MELLSQLGSGLSIGLACIGVAIGQGYLTFKVMETVGKNPKMHTYYLTIAILGIALVESAAIYGLITAFEILATTSIDPLASIGIGLSIGLAGLGVGVGEGKMISGAIEAMNRNPEYKNKIMTYMILFLALIESAAIYGLIVGFQILSHPEISGFNALAAGCAIGFAGLGAGIGEGIMAKKSLEVISLDISRIAFYLTISILGIALVESAAIYGLIIAFKLLSTVDISSVGVIGAGLAVGLAGLGVGIGEGIMVSGALDAMQRKPEQRGKLLTYMILFLALIESAAIYGLIIAFQIIDSSGEVGLLAVGAGLSIGLAGLGVGIGEGILTKKSLRSMSDDSSNTGFYLTITILGIALVESAAIYGLIISMQLLGSTNTVDMAGIGIGLAVGLAGLGVGIGEGKMVSGAIEAMKQSPETRKKIMTFMILFIALIESAAIYGLVIAFQLIDNPTVSGYAALGAGLAVGLAGLGVGIGEGLLSEKSLLVMAETPQMQSFYLTVTILGIALVESAAIYGLIIAFQIISEGGVDLLKAVGMGLAVGLAGLGVGIGEGNMIVGALKGINTNPDQKNKILTFMILFLALIESAAIYGLVIAYQIFSGDVIGLNAIGIGLAVGLAGLGVGIGEGILAKKTMETIGIDYKNAGYYMTISILGIALVESAAIYGLIIGVQLLTVVLLNPLSAIGVGLAIGLAGLGVGIGEGKMVGSAIQAMHINKKNRKKILTYMILFIALIESVAIYGLVMATQILQTPEISGIIAIGAGLAVGLSGLGVGIGEGTLSKYAMDVIGKNSKLQGLFLTTAILGIALVESAAIYGLVIGFQILGLSLDLAFSGLAAGIAIGLAALGAGIGEGMLVSGTFCSIYRNPAMKSRDIAFMVLFLALIEVLAIYGLIVAFQILS